MDPLVSTLKNNVSLHKKIILLVVFPITVKKNMNKRKAKRDRKHQFNALHKNELLFIASPSGKLMCIACESTLSDNTRHDISGHYKKHQVKIE